MLRRLYTLESLLGAVIVVSVLLTAILAPWLAPADPNALDLSVRFQAPGPAHLAGTDEVGRDVLSRIIVGARISLATGLGIVAMGCSLGTMIGCFSGLQGGKIDTLLMRSMDAVMALPGMVLALALTAALGPSLLNATLALGLVAVPYYARVARGETLSIRMSGYVLVARVTGASTLWQFRNNILPNCAPIILTYAISNLGTAIVAGATLSFIGLGAQPPTPEWGSMVNAGRDYLIEHWWCALFPGIAIAIATLGFNLLGDAFTAALDIKRESR